MRKLVIALTLLLSASCSDDGGDPSTAGTGGGASPTTSSSSSGGAGTGGETSSGGGPSTGGAGGATGTGGSDSATTGGAGGAGGSSDGGAGGTGGGATAELEWLPSWATTIQTTEPNNNPPPLGGKTLRQFVWPTVAGEEIRIQLSNEKGKSPVQIQKVHIALAKTSSDPGNSMGQIDTATDAAFTFGGMPNVTIPAGETVWSDPLDYPLPEIKLTAITMQFGNGVPSEITGHPGARTTSYIANGDAVAQEGLTGAETRDRWYFINAIEVKAPKDAAAIAVLGDSITDGYGILNKFARWPDFMTLAIKNDPELAKSRSVLNFGMGANNLTVTSEYQDAGVVRFERDVLKRDKIKWLIVFEGVNDINGGVQAQAIIDAYKQIITKSRAKGIKVYGSPITPMGSNNAVRNTVNEWVRTSGEFDAVIDLDAAIRDSSNPHSIGAMFKRDDGDNLHPSAAGYEAMGNAVPLSLFKL